MQHASSCSFGGSTQTCRSSRTFDANSFYMSACLFSSRNGIGRTTLDQCLLGRGNFRWRMACPGDLAVHSPLGEQQCSLWATMPRVTHAVRASTCRSFGARGQFFRKSGLIDTVIVVAQLQYAKVGQRCNVPAVTFKSI